MAIPNHVFDQLNSQADLVSIIGKHTTLKKAGNEFKGCCPFHGEKSPSFYVNPAKGMYHCFGCGVGGNALKFLQEYENLTFMEAVKELARQTGIAIPEDNDYKNAKYKRNVAPSVQPNNPFNNQPNAQPNAQPNNQFNAQANAKTNVQTGIQVTTQANSSLNQSVNQPVHQSQHNNPNIQANDNEISNINAYDDYLDSSFLENSFVDDDYADVYNGTVYNGIVYNDTFYNDTAYNNADYQASPAVPPLPLITEDTINEPQINSSEGNLYQLLEQVHAFYQQCLNSNAKAQAYFSSRGLTNETIATFGLGYAPSGWQHLEAQFPHDIEGLKLLGLVRRSEKGRDYDLLRDRVIFVIRDSQGRVIGFAGRALDNDVKPKYINSSESPVFHKQHVLYGYYESRQHRANNWLVVEGYMDVIALYQAGIYGAVASMGTAVNEQQISRLLTLNPVLTLSFDGDSAGQKAAWRTLEVSLPVLTDDKELRFLTLPNNHDPDTYVKEHGQSAMQEQIANATPLSEYVYHYLSNQHDLSRPEGKAKLMADVRNLTNQLPKGSTFRSLLNNDIYQKLSGRYKKNADAQNLLLNFKTQFTNSVNLCLCMLYQPSLLAQNPIDFIYQSSGVYQLNLPKSISQKVANGHIQLPALPDWQDFHDLQMLELVDNIQSLLPRLPKDANTASHFIMASISPKLRSSLTPHWQSFYANMMAREITDIQDFFTELLLHEILKALSQQQTQATNFIVRDILMRRQQALKKWEKSIQKI